MEQFATLGKSIPGSTVTLKNVGPTKVIEVIAKGKTLHTYYIEPPTDTDFALPACYPYNVCGGCGASSSALHACSRCMGRKYCSKTCQKKNWPMHRAICLAFSTDAMDQYLKSISGIKLEPSTLPVMGTKVNLPMVPTTL